MPSLLVSETPAGEVRDKMSGSVPLFETKIFSSDELLCQPWLPELAQVINDGFDANGGAVTFGKKRTSVAQLREELDENGFTAVAYTINSDELPSSGKGFEIIGTASVKRWLNDGQWQRIAHDDTELGSVDGNGKRDLCDGDYEIAMVTVRPGGMYRKRGIAGILLKTCEQEIQRRLSLQAEDARRPIRIMIRVVKEVNGPYWSKRGFTPVGQKKCPRGIWGSLSEFTMWAMFREMSE